MTDALDRLAGPGDDLFRRVEVLLDAGGVSAGSRVEGLLVRVGAMPGEVLDYALRLDVGSIRAAVQELRGLGDHFRVLPERLSADVRGSGWEGSGAEAFGVAWAALAAFIGGDENSIVGRVDATAAYLDGVAGWAEEFRSELAEAVARVLQSAEAVVVVTAAQEPEAVAAAARIAERVLRTAADALDAADRLRKRYEGRLGALEYLPPQVPRGAASITGVTRVTL
ncbi:hypothetical protein ACQP2P_03015 [Dactylosporangium sp. CA-139114]|uniref:hypothetical protein n=1 Tax=Dactylosporangium sp. CA-139114 TaxID=3239931 RepID=UPI003D97DBB7